MKNLEAEFHKAIAPILSKKEQGLVMGAFREIFAANDVSVRAFADGVKQLCEDYSSREGNVYVLDVQSSIDALVTRHTGGKPK